MRARLRHLTQPVKPAIRLLAACGSAITINTSTNRPHAPTDSQHTTMKYDRLGFPIPPQFPPPLDQPVPGGRRPERVPGGAGKKVFLIAVFLGLVVPGVLAPWAMPLVRAAVVQWSLERADALQGRGDLDAAVTALGRAIRWCREPDLLGELLCRRARLRLEDRDPAGARTDVERAIAVTPTAAAPLRMRALVHVVANQPDAALADAHAAVELAGRADPDALNFRAYVRALVGRDLPAALNDIDAALAGSGASTPAFLDTRGFVLHLLDRHQEAIDQLNLAIDETQTARRRLMALAGRVDTDDLAFALRSVDQDLAVMLHHRGLACRAIGLEGQARQDFESATRKGYDESRGIF